MQNIIVFLVEVHLKLVLGNFSEISHCEIDFYNVYVELYRISTKVETTLKQEIIKLVKFNTIKSIGNIGFSFP